MADQLKQAESRGVGIGMAIAAAIVADWDDVRAGEILSCAGLTTFDDLRSAGVDDYDIKKLRFVVKNIAQRERNLRGASTRGFAALDRLAA